MTEKYSEHLLNELSRRPNFGNVSTETCSELLLTGLLRSFYNCHLRTETYS
jgi:hypothetical protein